MRLLAADNRVLWVNSVGNRRPAVSRRDLGRAARKLAAVAQPVREVEPNLFVLNPLAVPLYGPGGRRVNRMLLRAQVRRVMRHLGFRRPVNWVFNPAAAVVAGELNESAVIYYCVDEYKVFAGVSTRRMAELEDRLLRRADLVITSSDRLYHAKRRTNRHTVLVRHGVDHAHFSKALDPATEVPAEVRDLPRPVIGYFGLLAEDWVDTATLVQVARRFPTGSLVLIGTSMMDLSALTALPNVHLLGRKPYASLPGYCKGFDVSLIPFPVSEVTLNANPLKCREYLAAGLPVVSTPIPEVEVTGLCRIGRGPTGFADQVGEALAAEPGPRAWRSEAVRGESWAARLDEIRAHVAAHLG
ncbi:MAG TPA: glycosyltransferase [Gemmataceae bacterium]|nr:glycosyltransferase [Gemmataceae bacterium]